MKQNNKKQIAYSQKKVAGNITKALLSLFVVVFVCFLFPALIEGVTNNNWTAFGGLVYGGAIGAVKMGSMALIGNIDQPSDIETAPNQIGFRLYLTATEQVDQNVSFPLPDANRDVATIPLKSGEYMHYFEGVKDSVKFNSTGEKGDVTTAFNKTLPIIVKYNSQSLNFIEQYSGKGFIPIWKECESNTYETVGSTCKPMYLTNFEVKKDSDGKYIMLTFGNDHWRQPANYVGNIITQSPVTVAQDATQLPIESGNNIYQLQDPSSANVTIVDFAALASADVGRSITILAPAVNTYDNIIADNANFVLKDGTSWTAKPGSQIVFEVFDTDTFIEVDRIQTA